MALSIVLAVVVDVRGNIAKPKPDTFMGRGAVERIGEIIAAHADADEAVTLVVMDCPLSPVQQRNLEQAWNCKVIDRTGLILEIFGARARTREGRLQVELAALTYQRSRLVRSWTHLERQRGGAGFMGGPGERQIELDRRLIDQRIDRIKRDLKDVRRTRALHRDARQRVPYPVIALVGYTNAGKSTLFNHLTGSDVVAKDQLFATLDPTMRAIELPGGHRAILSDTVGFVSSLPHELVNAFHATLEEVEEADVIVHVRDIAHAETETQRTDVMGVLSEIGIDETKRAGIIEVLNKIDLLDDAAREYVANRAQRSNLAAVPVSAQTGEGCASLRQLVADRLSAGFETLELSIDPADGAGLAWLYQHGEVVERRDDEDAIHVKVRLSPAEAARYQHQAH
ncbi:MAG: GTPase HflX [Magnetovibrio sp.]|nr:GTPase HflX [Magnetovibrio sp.]